MDKLDQLLSARFPNQGFGTGAPLPEGIEKVILTWGTIFDLAKKGHFENIRPDLRVQFFDKILAIYNCN